MVKRILPILILALFFLSISGCSSSQDHAATKQTLDANQSTITQPAENPSGQLKVHFLDVGQADSILVQVPNGQNMLIDAGNNDDTVIKSFDIGSVYMPRVTHTTKPYEDVLKVVQAKGLKIIPAKAGTEIVRSDGLSAFLLVMLKIYPKVK